MVEDSIEAALAELAELQATMVRARPITRAGYNTVQAAFEQIAETTKGLIAARASIGHCHEALVDAKQTIPGLRTVSYGDEGNCPEKTGQVDLRIVA